MLAIVKLDNAAQKCEISSHETCRVSLKTNNLKYVIFNIPGQKCKTAKRDLSGFLLYLLHVLD